MQWKHNLKFFVLLNMSKIKKLTKIEAKDVRAGYCPFCDLKLKIKLKYRICYNCNKVYKIYNNTKWKAFKFSVVLNNEIQKVVGREEYFFN